MVTLRVVFVILSIISVITTPLLIGVLIYLFKSKENKKKLKVIIIVLLAFYLVTIISFFFIRTSFGSEEDRINYASQNEFGQLFLEYYPEAQTEFNAAGDMVTFKHVEGEASIYIPVPAMKYREGDGGTLYCYKNELTFEFSNLEEMRDRLESNECFK